MCLACRVTHIIVKNIFFSFCSFYFGFRQLRPSSKSCARWPEWKTIRGWGVFISPCWSKSYLGCYKGKGLLWMQGEHVKQALNPVLIHTLKKLAWCLIMYNTLMLLALLLFVILCSQWFKIPLGWQGWHSCVPGLIPGTGIISGLSLLLLLFSSPGGFSPVTLVSFLLKNQHFQIPILAWIVSPYCT